MWVKVDDGFPQHPKVIAAAGRLRGINGMERVLSVWLQVMCYSNRHLTDGFISDAVAAELRGTKPRDVLKVLAERSVRLLGRVRGGWQVHDYHDYQPSKKEIETKRRKERKRLRNRRASSKATPKGVRAYKPRTTPQQLAVYEDPDPIRSDPARTEPKIQDQEQRADARDSHRVLVKLAHDILDAPDAATLPEHELSARLKDSAAAARIAYDGREIAKALDAARGSRARRSA